MRLLKYFSLVEMALGVAILAIGVTAAISLVPVGIKENKESSGKNYIAIATQDIQSYITSRSVTDFNNFVNLFPTTEPDTSLALTSLDGLVKLAGAESGKSGIYATSANNTSGVYAVEFYSGDTIDFDAQLNIWKSAPYGAGADSGVSSGSGGLSVYSQSPVVNGVTSTSQAIAQVGNAATEKPITGEIKGINPGKSENYEFVMKYKKSDGTIASVDITSMTAGTYNAVGMEIRLKGKFDSNSVKIGGAAVEIDKKKFFINAPEGKTFSVTLANPNGNKWNISGLSGNVATNESSGIYVPAQSVTGVTVSGSKGTYSVAGINVELSWPINKPYAQRAKYKYYFEIQEPSN